MLLVKTKVKKSPIAGYGLFAEENIKKGEVVWKFSPETSLVVTKQHFKSLKESFHKKNGNVIDYFLKYGFYVSELDAVIIALDNGRYVNTSKNPNIGGNPAPGSKDQSIALRDIAKGEEITEDYDTYDSCAWYLELNPPLFFNETSAKSLEAQYEYAFS